MQKSLWSDLSPCANTNPSAGPACADRAVLQWNLCSIKNNEILWNIPNRSMTALPAFKATEYHFYNLEREWMDLERLPSFSALLVKTVVIVTIFWRDVIYASFMGFFFWCHVIYWHAMFAAPLQPQSRSEVVENLFIQDKTLTLGCQTLPLRGNNESLRNSVQPRTFLQAERCVLLMRNIKMCERGTGSVWNTLCVTSVICLIPETRKWFMFDRFMHEMMGRLHGSLYQTRCQCFLYVC